MRKSNTKEDYWRRKQLIRGSGSGSIPPKHWPTALIVCPSSLIRNVGANPWPQDSADTFSGIERWTRSVRRGVRVESAYASVGILRKGYPENGELRRCEAILQQGISGCRWVRLSTPADVSLDLVQSATSQYRAHQRPSLLVSLYLGQADPQRCDSG